MRRTLPLLVTATLLFAACSSDDDTASTESATESTDETGSTEPIDETATADDVPSVTPPNNPDKPEVEIPDEPPTELVVTVIEEGTGPAAAAGDKVLVDYVGVRSRDGVEFDNSYDRGEPFSLTLGQGNVITGWDQGLDGVQAGARVRLDIPSDLAYGPDARGDIIGENEALTFLIDVRAVVDPADAPTEPGVPPSEGATETTFTDLIEGDGDEIEAGQTALINYVLFRGDNLVALESSWEAGPVPVPTAEGGFPGFVQGLPGMKVGGRRTIVVPPDNAARVPLSKSSVE